MAPKNSKQRKNLYPNLRLDPVDFSYSDNTSGNEEKKFDRPMALRPEADIYLEEESSQDKYKPRKKRHPRGWRGDSRLWISRKQNILGPSNKDLEIW